jgi:hypothetical protein
MNAKRLILAVLVVFVAVWVTDFLIHGVWLQSTYKETAHLWRTEEEMVRHMGWMFLGQFLASLIFVILWAAGFASRSSLRLAGCYGLLMAAFQQAITLIMHAVQPMPVALSAKWFLAGLAQGVLMGLLVFFVYKPKPGAATAPETARA